VLADLVSFCRNLILTLENVVSKSVPGTGTGVPTYFFFWWGGIGSRQKLSDLYKDHTGDSHSQSYIQQKKVRIRPDQDTTNTGVLVFYRYCGGSVGVVVAQSI
jgi:hypothetical protein